MSISDTFSARWIFPSEGDPIEYGIIEVQNGKISAIRKRRPQEKLEIDENKIIIPPLVNAHTHLDLESIDGPNNFLGWLEAVFSSRKRIDEEKTIRENIQSLMDFGVSFVGDISNNGKSFEILKKFPIKARVFYEILGLKPERISEKINGASTWLKSETDQNILKGISPHAPFSTTKESFLWAINEDLPLAIHLAETEEELLFLKEKKGEFRDLLNKFNAWNEDADILDVSQIINLTQHVKSLLLIHCNYLDQEINKLSKGTKVVFCPRTHEKFNHKKYPLDKFLKAGIKVCLGTDSLASNPDLDPLKELSLVLKKFPEINCETAVKMATIWGSEALGFGDFGALKEDSAANFLELHYETTQNDKNGLLREMPQLRQVFQNGRQISENPPNS